MTQSTKPERELQLRFDFGTGKPIEGWFDAGKISSDGGLVLVGVADRKLKLSEQIAGCLVDKRQPGKVQHEIIDQIRQRLCMITAAYEDLNDADRLSGDPVHKMVVGRNPVTDLDLASDSTLVRFENDRTEGELKDLQELLVRLFIQQHKRAPDRIVLDMDTTCDEVHGYQQLSFYNGFYKTYCYTPLFYWDQAELAYVGQGPLPGCSGKDPLRLALRSG